MYRSWTSHKSARAGLGKNTYRLPEGTLRLLAKASQSSRIQGWISNRRFPQRAGWRYWDHVEVELTFRCPITLRSWSASPQESVAVSTLIDRRLGVAGSLSIETASKGGSSRSNYDPEHNRRGDCRAAIIPSARGSGCRGTRTAQRCRPRQCLHCLLGCLDLQERSDCGNISQRFLRIAMQLWQYGGRSRAASWKDD